MPELPEVETIVRRLQGVLPGRTVVRARILRSNVVRGSARRFAHAVEEARIERVERRAKFVVIRLAGERVWLSHLRMSGRWLLAPRRPEGARAALSLVREASGAAFRGPSPDALPAYTRAVFELDDGSRLLYVDPRTLGEMELLAAAEWERREAALGPEPLDPEFTPALLAARLAESRRSVKEFLLDQTKVAGLGNIYAAEALWRARISPRRRARNLGAARARRLHRAIVDVLRLAVGRSGTTLGATYLDFVDADGEAGAFYTLLRVYDREGEPCVRCGTPIARIVQGQRSTYFCPRCQQ